MTDFPSHDDYPLVNRMNQVALACLCPRPKLNFEHNISNRFERFPKWLQRNLSWVMLVPDCDDSLSLQAIHRSKFKAVSKQAGVPRIRVQNVHGPILGGFPVITEGSNELNFKGPLSLK